MALEVASEVEAVVEGEAKLSPALLQMVTGVAGVADSVPGMVAAGVKRCRYRKGSAVHLVPFPLRPLVQGRRERSECRFLSLGNHHIHRAHSKKFDQPRVVLLLTTWLRTRRLHAPSGLP